MSPAIKNDRFEGSGGVMGCQLFRRPLPALTAHSSGRSPFDHFILFFFFFFFYYYYYLASYFIFSCAVMCIQRNPGR